MNTSPEFNRADGPPNWKQAVKLWNRQADMTDEISYKACQKIFNDFTLLILFETVAS
jgi:hypothetical protein